MTALTQRDAQRPVDVLAAVDGVNKGLSAIGVVMHEMVEAREAVAELMRAVAGVVAYEGDPRFPDAVLADNRRLLAEALARCGGAA